MNFLWFGLFCVLHRKPYRGFEPVEMGEVRRKCADFEPLRRDVARAREGVHTHIDVLLLYEFEEVGDCFGSVNSGKELGFSHFLSQKSHLPA